MSLKSKQFIKQMEEFLSVPPQKCEESIERYGEFLETVVIEDILMPEFLLLLQKNENANLLKEIFDYFEEVVNSDDLHLINIFSITVLEILGNDKSVLEVVKKYMGKRTSQLQLNVDKELGRL